MVGMNRLSDEPQYLSGAEQVFAPKQQAVSKDEEQYDTLKRIDVYLNSEIEKLNSVANIRTLDWDTFHNDTDRLRHVDQQLVINKQVYEILAPVAQYIKDSINNVDTTFRERMDT